MRKTYNLPLIERLKYYNMWQREDEVVQQATKKGFTVKQANGKMYRVTVEEVK